MAHKSAYPGTLILPDGREIATGTSLDLTQDDLKNEGVTDWIRSGWLVSGAARSDAAPTKSDLRRQAEELGISVDGRWSDERIQSEIDKKLDE